MINQSIHRFFEAFKAHTKNQINIQLGGNHTTKPSECLVVQLIELSPSAHFQSKPKDHASDPVMQAVRFTVYVLADYTNYSEGLHAIEVLYQFVHSTPVHSLDTTQGAAFNVLIHHFPLMEQTMLTQTYNEKRLPFLTLEFNDIIPILSEDTIKPPNMDMNIISHESSVPCFIGYTQKALLNNSFSAINKLIKINSISDFKNTFGNEDPSQTFYLFHSVQSYFNNGGGTCYVFSIGDYQQSPSELHFSQALSILGNEATLPFQIIIAPDATSLSHNGISQFYTLLLDFCSETKTFCILDLQKEDAFGIGIRTLLPSTNLSYGAMYSPWLKIEHDGNILEIPPSGTVAGIYCQVDNQRGVWKAPANISLSNIIGTGNTFSEVEIEKLQIDVETGKSINPLRAFTGKGILVWGARTLAGNDNEWRYIPVRRFVNMVQLSIEQSLKWVHFEPNNANTWQLVKNAIDQFLSHLWRQGALAGNTPSEAYFVRVGQSETMTKEDVEQGRLLIDIGLACLRPAEFVIVKIKLFTAVI